MPGVSNPERVRAVRGAITLDEDSRAEILSRTQQLLAELFDRNDLDQDDVISMIFTSTGDLCAAFPAEAAREAGFERVPLLCARELEIEGGIPMCIRVLVHAYTDRGSDELRHTYLREARQLRTDLPE